LYLSLLFKKFSVAHLELIFLDVFVFFWHVNYSDVFVTFLVNCILELMILPGEGSSLLPKGSVLFGVFL
jgi:hypothetical protein